MRTVADDGYVVFVEQERMLIPSRFDQAGYFRYLNWIWERIAGWAAVFEQSSMPWFGGKKGASSFLCIIETPDDVAYGIIANDVRSPEQPRAPASAIPAANTAALHTGSFRYLALLALCEGGPGLSGNRTLCVSAARRLRRNVQDLSPTLRESRQAGHPEAENRGEPGSAKLIGGPNLEIQVVANRPGEPQFQSLSGAVYDGNHRLLTTFDQIAAIVHDLKTNLGVDRAVIRVAGWGRKAMTTYGRSTRPSRTPKPAVLRSSPRRLRRPKLRDIWAGCGTTTGTLT